MAEKPIPVTRQTNIELLRIVSMLMIITLHTFLHGGILDSVTEGSWQYYFAKLLDSFCLIAVNCYVLISGYFLCTSKFKLKKLLIILGQIFFYSVVLYVISYALGVMPMDPFQALSAVLPVISRTYWFATVYVAMYILFPFFNIVIEKMDQKSHKRLLILLLVMFLVIPNIFFYSEWLPFGGGMSITWFTVLYFFAAYLRKYYTPEHKPARRLFKYLAWSLCIPASVLLLEYAQNVASIKFLNYDAMTTIKYQMLSYNSVFVFLASLFFFKLFLNINIKNRILTKIVLFIAPCTFGIYLIHDNPFFSKYLWARLNMPQYIENKYFVLIVIGIIVTIFIVCALIEHIRLMLFRPINKSKWLDNVSNKISNRLGID